MKESAGREYSDRTYLSTEPNWDCDCAAPFDRGVISHDISSLSVMGCSRCRIFGESILRFAATPFSNTRPAAFLFHDYGIARRQPVRGLGGLP
jgi:hypothetical protein